MIFPPPLLRPRGANRWEAEIIGRDQFGNCLTSLTRAAAGGGAAGDLLLGVRGGLTRLPLADCYGSVPAGRPLAVWGSCGFLELAVNGGSAARALKLEVGEPITAELITESGGTAGDRSGDETPAA